MACIFGSVWAFFEVKSRPGSFCCLRLWRGPGERPQISDSHLYHRTSFNCFLKAKLEQSCKFLPFSQDTQVCSWNFCFLKSTCFFYLFLFSFLKKSFLSKKSETSELRKEYMFSFFPPTSFFFSPTTTILKVQNVCSSPAISVLPFIYQVIYSYIYLKYRSTAYDPCTPSSNSLFQDGAQAVPQLQFSGRVWWGERWDTHTHRHTHFTME